MCIYLVHAVLLKNLQCYFYKHFWVYIYSLISVVNFSFTTEAFIYKLVYMDISDALFSDSCCYSQYQNIILFIIIYYNYYYYYYYYCCCCFDPGFHVSLVGLQLTE